MILKLAAGIAAAIIATKIIVIKTESDSAASAPAGKWSLTTEGLLGISALWIALVFSTGVDILNYRKDVNSAADNERKRLELIDRENEIKGLAGAAKNGIDEANKQLKASADTLAGVANTTNETLGSVNTANDRLKTSASTLGQVVQRQIKATATVNNTLARLIETSDVVHRTSKPLRPLDFTLSVKYESTNTSEDIKQYVEKVKSYVDDIDRTDRANRVAGQPPVRKDNWDYDKDKIHITGPTPLLGLGGRRVEQILTSGAFGIKIRPTEMEAPLVMKNQVALIGYSDFTRTPPFRLSPLVRIVPPPNLQIEIDRNSGDIIERFLIKTIDREGAVFGVNSLYDLPSKWLEISLLAPVNVSDNPKIKFFSFQNDTFITNGKFPESLILDANRFKGPTTLRPSRDNPDGAGVAFLYQLGEDDLNSAARFENQRR